MSHRSEANNINKSADDNIADQSEITGQVNMAPSQRSGARFVEAKFKQGTVSNEVRVVDLSV